MDDGETELLPARRRRSVVLPWLLFLLVAGGGGYLYWTAHRPLAEQAAAKDATIAELTRTLADARKEADAAKAQLADAQAQAKQARDDLARSAAQKAADDQLLARLKQEAAAGGAEVAGAGGQITVTMVDKILFRSGEADLTPDGERVLRALGAVFNGTDKLIEVSGHADNLPVESELKELYPTNWELSTARATNVVRFLEEQVGIKARRLKASGYGASRPVASNVTAVGRARNRRIEILLLPDKLKVVKGDFTDEIAAAKPAKDPAPRPSDRERVKAVTALRAKQAAAKQPPARTVAAKLPAKKKPKK